MTERYARDESVNSQPIMDMSINFPAHLTEAAASYIQEQFSDKQIRVLEVIQREPALMVAGVGSSNGDETNVPKSFLDLPNNAVQIVTDFIGVVGGIAGIAGFTMQVADKLRGTGEVVNKGLKELRKRGGRKIEMVQFQHIHKLGENITIGYTLKFEDEGEDKKTLKNFQEIVRDFYKHNSSKD